MRINDDDDDEIQDGWRPQNWTDLYRNSVTVDCSILLTFGKKFDHVTADTLQTFKVKNQCYTLQ